MQYISSKTGDEGNIYAAKQGMRACNNSNMSSPDHQVETLWLELCCFACVIRPQPAELPR